MFESIVATILNRYLSEYIDEVDYNNLKLGIFSGEFRNYNLSLLSYLYNIFYKLINAVLGSLELLNVKVKPSALVSMF